MKANYIYGMIKVSRTRPNNGVFMPRMKKHNVDKTEAKTMTVEELLNSGLVGIWKDRTDIKDNVDFARELREKAWTHKDEKHDSC